MRARNRLAALAGGVLVVAGLVVASPAASAAAGNYTASGLSASVSGTTVTVRVTIKARTAKTVTYAGICARSATGADRDFPLSRNVRITTAGTSFTKSQSLPAGTYSYGACVLDGSWQSFPTATFTVGSTPATTTSTTTTPPVTPEPSTPTTAEAPPSSTSSPTTTTAPPTTTVTPTPVGADPSGQAMPTTSSAGFTNLGGTNFATPAAAGSVARVTAPYDGAYAKFIWPRPENSTDNYGGTYRFQRSASVQDGTLRVVIGTIDGANSGAAWTWKHPVSGWGFTYGAVEQRVRVTTPTNLAGYGSASLLWPDNNMWGDGELDYPEGGFDGDTHVYHHCLGSNPAANCSIFDTNTSWTGWHTYRVEWRKNNTTYLIDGRVVGINDNATPSTPHNWVTQIGRHYSGTFPADRAGTYEVDWVRFESLN